jgi:hypothetical protein
MLYSIRVDCWGSPAEVLTLGNAPPPPIGAHARAPAGHDTTQGAWHSDSAPTIMELAQPSPAAVQAQSSPTDNHEPRASEPPAARQTSAAVEANVERLAHVDLHARDHQHTHEHDRVTGPDGSVVYVHRHVHVHRARDHTHSHEHAHTYSAPPDFYGSASQHGKQAEPTGAVLAGEGLQDIGRDADAADHTNLPNSQLQTDNETNQTSGDHPEDAPAARSHQSDSLLHDEGRPYACAVEVHMQIGGNDPTQLTEYENMVDQIMELRNPFRRQQTGGGIGAKILEMLMSVAQNMAGANVIVEENDGTNGS